MRILGFLIIALASLSAAFAAPPRPWHIEVKWGDSIPAGTVFDVRVDSSGTVKGERKGLPFTQGGKLSTNVLESALSPAQAEAIRVAVEEAIRSVNLKEVQGSMAGDGGFMQIYLWDGTVALALQVNRLSEYPDPKSKLGILLGKVEPLAPSGTTN